MGQTEGPKTDLSLKTDPPTWSRLPSILLQLTVGKSPSQDSGWIRYSMVASGPNVFPSHAVLILSLPPSWADASRVAVRGHGISCVTFLPERRDLGGKPQSSAPAARWQRPQPIRSTELRARPAGSPSPLPGLFCDQGPPPPPPPRGRRGDSPA